MTLDQLKARRDAYLAAELRILESQEFRTGAGSDFRHQRRAELDQVRAALKEINAEIERVEGAASGARRVYNLVPNR